MLLQNVTVFDDYDTAELVDTHVVICFNRLPYYLLLDDAQALLEDLKRIFHEQ